MLADSTAGERLLCRTIWQPTNFFRQFPGRAEMRVDRLSSLLPLSLLPVFVLLLGVLDVLR